VTAGPPLVVLGDALLDRDVRGRSERLSPEAPAPVVDVGEENARPGGAGLAALLAARDGHSVVLVSAVGRDRAGERLRGLLGRAGVELVDLGLDGPTPEKIRVLADGHLLVRIDRGEAGGAAGPWTTAAAAAVASAGAVLVADYGRGLAAREEARAAVASLPARVPVVWDPHPKGPAPVPGVRLATPNRREAALVAAEVTGTGLAVDAARARVLADRWEARAVAVTRGSDGAVLWSGDGPPLAIPAPPATGDPCGAGDRFAASVTGLLAAGALPSEAVTRAVLDASLFIADGGAAGVGRGGNGAAPSPAPPEDPVTLAQRVRAEGGVVVAAGGCFDLLHAGHVRLLEAARALGDCLVVCLNSDESVRRLKGPGRPVVPAHDRAEVLLGLTCVDAVAVFGEDTPTAVLELLRPHLFVKGGDYGARELPEDEALARWGGQAVLVPYLEGRSTTNLLAGTRVLRTTPASTGGDPNPAGRLPASPEPQEAGTRVLRTEPASTGGDPKPAAEAKR
jgi:D-beta-D-heptose 7-phosphate kinase/D-beta-D-heptose 1-phosphate adenosyltransferase